MQIEVPGMEYDQEKIEDVVLALLAAYSFDEGRAWKGFSFEVMDRLHARGLIDDPKSKAKSVWLTAEGREQGRKFAEQLFGASRNGAQLFNQADR